MRNANANQGNAMFNSFAANVQSDEFASDVAEFNAALAEQAAIEEFESIDDISQEEWDEIFAIDARCGE